MCVTAVIVRQNAATHHTLAITGEESDVANSGMAIIRGA